MRILDLFMLLTSKTMVFLGFRVKHCLCKSTILRHGYCGPVASRVMVIRRYLVSRGRAHTPQVVVAPSEASAGLRPPPDPRAAARAGSQVPARQGSEK